MLWCSLSVFIGLSAISQGGVTRFIPGILVSTTILFYLIVIRANSVTYSSLKQFNTKTGVLSIASSAGTLCCVADTIYHMVMKSGAISKLMSKGISTTTIQAVVVIALLTMSFIAMYGVSVIFNYILSNVVASKASITSYLPYEKGVYFPSTADKEKISVGAERQRRYRAVRKLRTEPTEEHLWEVVLLYAGVRFKTYSGLPFTYEIRKGRNGQYTKELWIDRRENSKSLAWSSVLLALGNIKKVGEVVERPKALGDIRGVTYIYGMFYRFGLIDVPDEAKEKMKKAFSKSF